MAVFGGAQETVVYGIDQVDLHVMRRRVKQGRMSHDECMRTLAESYKISRQYHDALKERGEL